MGLYFSKVLFIFGGTYVRREMCFSKSIGLAYSWKVFYRFCFVLLCIWGQIPSTSLPGGLYLTGPFKGGFFVMSLGGLYLEGLIHGGVYFWNFPVCPVWLEDEKMANDHWSIPSMFADDTTIFTIGMTYIL